MHFTQPPTKVDLLAALRTERQGVRLIRVKFLLGNCTAQAPWLAGITIVGITGRSGNSYASKVMGGLGSCRAVKHSSHPTSRLGRSLALPLLRLCHRMYLYGKRSTFQSLFF